MEENMKNIDNLRTLLETLTKRAIPLERYGVFVASDNNGNLYSCPMETGGSPEYDEDFPTCYAFMEVTAPEQDFLNAVNESLGSSYTEKEFAGR
jgi:hypothetical protein